jgi:deazaflavin-dependent oxidoreductase (nitroreductase family)
VSNLDHPTEPPGGFALEHLRRYRGTNGADGHEWRPGVYTLLLTTIGRRSGQARQTPLIYGRDGANYLVVASKGGADIEPQWYANLTANPTVRVQVADEVVEARARTATPEEKQRLWPRMAEIWPPYDEYQLKTARDIPIVILEPTSDVAH